MKKVMFYCQNVLGMGHLIRSMEIVRGLKDFEVRFVNGGEIVPGFTLPPSVEVVHLPPLKSDADFTQIQAVDEGQSLADIKEARTRSLLAEFERFKPDLVIVELFPFGRKKFAFELVPLLARIRLSGGSTKVVCSLRDILVSNKRDQARHEERVCLLMNRYFDLLLVHADPQFQPLGETFSRIEDLKTVIRYTGYIVQSSQPHAEVLNELDELDETDIPMDAAEVPLILVSIGGGRVGYELLAGAVQASAILTHSLPHRMLIFTGPYLSDAEFLQLHKLIEHTPQISLRRYTTHFLSYMEKADLSISMAGYNTCMNILTTRVRALVLPFTGGNNNEQPLRAEKLAALGAVTVIRPHELQPDRLAEKIVQGLKTTPTSPFLDLHGVENTAAFVTDLLRRRDAAGQHPVEIPRQSNGLQVLEAELRLQLERCQEEGKEIPIFLRDDDVDEDEETLRHLMDLTLSHRVPLNLEVIPSTLTEAGIKLLDTYTRFCPTLLALHQHGWRHLNYEKEGRKSEFGISRSFHEQREDIAKGKALLEELFEERFAPVFTPPWNRCTEDTFTILDQLNFQGLSKDQGKHPITGYRFREISTTLDLYRWKGGPSMKSPEEIVRGLLSQIRHSLPIGILLHHQVMDTQAFAFLDHLLAELGQYSVVRFHTLQNLL